jgi:hypothetical protein
VLDRDEPVAAGGGITPLGTGAPLAILERIEALRGYNPLDVLRYKEYLQFIADDDAPLRPFEGALTHPILGNFPIKNKALLDLLGTRFLLQPSDPRFQVTGEERVDRDRRWQRVFQDPHPEAYVSNISGAGGRLELSPYAVYENRENLYPRAFVVPQAVPLPERSKVLSTLKATDFRQTVLLEGEVPEVTGGSSGGGFRPARVREYLPNRVDVEVETGAPGYLVLADVWFPGWTCTVDGRPAVVHRANYLFRAVAVPPGSHEVVFAFTPVSYTRGQKISTAAAAFVLLVSGVGAIGAFRRRKRTDTGPTSEPGA